VSKINGPLQKWVSRGLRLHIKVDVVAQSDKFYLSWNMPLWSRSCSAIG